jgi:hypothetical protein
MQQKSEAWQAEQERQRQAAAFAESVKPAVDHALTTLAAAEADSTVTVAELETLRANVELARAGELEKYTAADTEWRQRQANKIVSQAVEVGAQARELEAKRDALLQAAYKPLESEPIMVDVVYPDNFYDPARAGKTIREPLPQ